MLCVAWPNWRKLDAVVFCADWRALWNWPPYFLAAFVMVLAYAAALVEAPS